MPRHSKPKTTTDGRPSQSVYWAPEGTHPADVSGLFENDPAFEEFRDILREQREEDSRRANEEIDAMIREEEEAKRCSSSTPIPSRTIRTRIKSSSGIFSLLMKGRMPTFGNFKNCASVLAVKTFV